MSLIRQKTALSELGHRNAQGVGDRTDRLELGLRDAHQQRPERGRLYPCLVGQVFPRHATLAHDRLDPLPPFAHRDGSRPASRMARRCPSRLRLALPSNGRHILALHGITCPRPARNHTVHRRPIHPEGLEPSTFGSVDRCSTRTERPRVPGVGREDCTGGLETRRGQRMLSW